MKEEIEARLNRAHRTLSAGDSLVAGGYLEEAVARVYYAMYYAASAMHCAEGRTYKRHKHLFSDFGKYFVVTGRVSKDFHRYLRKTEALRLSADYDYGRPMPSIEEARDLLTKAREFVTMAEEFLKGSGGKHE